MAACFKKGLLDKIRMFRERRLCLSTEKKAQKVLRYKIQKLFSIKSTKLQTIQKTGKIQMSRDQRQEDECLPVTKGVLLCPHLGASLPPLSSRVAPVNSPTPFNARWGTTLRPDRNTEIPNTDLIATTRSPLTNKIALGNGWYHV